MLRITYYCKLNPRSPSHAEQTQGGSEVCHTLLPYLTIWEWERGDLSRSIMVSCLAAISPSCTTRPSSSVHESQLIFLYTKCNMPLIVEMFIWHSLQKQTVVTFIQENGGTSTNCTKITAALYQCERQTAVIGTAEVIGCGGLIFS